MKKIFSLMITVSFLVNADAQSIGINTNTPDPSAALEIKSDNKGLLLPRVTLQTDNDNTTISSPATGLMVYNTNLSMTKGKGFYFNNGTSVTPSWKKIGTSDFDIPYINSANTSTALFSLANHGNGMVAYFSSTDPNSINTVSVSSESNSSNSTVFHAMNGYSSIALNYKRAIVGEMGGIGIGVAGLSQSAYGVYGESVNATAIFGLAHANTTSGVKGETDSPNGFGVHGYAPAGGIAGFFSSTAAGVSIRTSGPLDIRNTGSTAGKVLMVDANGNAGWEGAIAFAVKGGAVVAPANSSYVLPQSTEEFDISGNFLLNSSIINPNTFTAPVDGVYHFDGSIIWTISPGENYFAYTVIWVNGAEKIAVYDWAHADADFTSHLSRDIKLNQGDKITFGCKSNSLSGITIFSSFFSGHLLFRL